MTEPMSEYGSRARATPPGWATGFIVFAAVIMMMTGVFQALEGLAAIFENQFYVVARNYLYEVDVTAWGWIHLVLGVVVALAGFGVLSGATWARAVGIALAVLSAIANFLFIPYYPFWSLLIIVLDMFVIRDLAAYGGRVAT
jgi:hypothetical protein